MFVRSLADINMNRLELNEKDTFNATIACALAVCGVQEARAAPSMHRQGHGRRDEHARIRAKRVVTKPAAAH